MKISVRNNEKGFQQSLKDSSKKKKKRYLPEKKGFFLVFKKNLLVHVFSTIREK